MSRPPRLIVGRICGRSQQQPNSNRVDHFAAIVIQRDPEAP
jgi:hypothetical protein